MKTEELFEVTKVIEGDRLFSIKLTRLGNSGIFDAIFSLEKELASNYTIGSVWKRKVTKKGKEKYKLVSNKESEKVKQQFRKELTYIDVQRSLLIRADTTTFNIKEFVSSVHQLEKLFALNKLLNVAVYLNPENKEAIWSICLISGCIDLSCVANNLGQPKFISETSAQQAIEILGEDLVKLALS